MAELLVGIVAGRHKETEVLVSIPAVGIDLESIAGGFRTNYPNHEVLGFFPESAIRKWVDDLDAIKIKAAQVVLG